MSFLGALDDDDVKDIAIIRAPKAPIAAQKPLVPAGPAVVKRYPIRLSDYRRRPAANGTVNANNTAAQSSVSNSYQKQICIVIDEAEMETIFGSCELEDGSADVAGMTSPTIVFKPALRHSNGVTTISDSNGTITATTTRRIRSRSSDDDSARRMTREIPFAATVLSTMPNEGSTASDSSSSATSSIFAVDMNSTDVSAPVLVLTPIEKIWRARRMVEVETANNNPNAGGLSKAWSMAMEVMDKRDKAISGEVSHYDDAIEEAPAGQMDAGQVYEARAKKLRAEAEELRANTATALSPSVAPPAKAKGAKGKAVLPSAPAASDVVAASTAVVPVAKSSTQSILSSLANRMKNSALTTKQQSPANNLDDDSSSPSAFARDEAEGTGSPTNSIAANSNSSLSSNSCGGSSFTNTHLSKNQLKTRLGNIFSPGARNSPFMSPASPLTAGNLRENTEKNTEDAAPPLTIGRKRDDREEEELYHAGEAASMVGGTSPKRIRFEDTAAGASSSSAAPLVVVALTPAASSTAFVVDPSSATEDITLQHISQERIAGNTRVEAGKFVGRILKSLPDFAAVAAARDRQREAEWLKEAKARVIRTLRIAGCVIAEGHVAFPQN